MLKLTVLREFVCQEAVDVYVRQARFPGLQVSQLAYFLNRFLVDCVGVDS
jgi:hypothetical protein